MNIFQQEIENQAIERTQKFSKIADKMGLRSVWDFRAVKIVKSFMIFACDLGLISKFISIILSRAILH